MVVEIICRLFQLQGSILCTKFPELWAADSMLLFRVARERRFLLPVEIGKGFCVQGGRVGRDLNVPAT